MRYVIVGAGAIGGTIGGLLASTGRDVLLVARGEHAAAMKQDGLRLARPDSVLVLDVPVVDDVASLVLRRGDVLVLAVKSQASADLLGQLARLPVDGRAAAEVLPVLLAQNGVNNEREALRRFTHVHGVCVMLPATHLEPGQVQASGSPQAGVLDLGRYPSGSDDVDAAVAADLVASGFGATVRTDVMAWKRAKLLRNVGNALEALSGHDLDEASTSAWDDLEARARKEAEAAFAAAGLRWVDDEQWAANRGGRAAPQPVEGQERGGGSTWQSVSRGLGNVEADYLNGEVVLLGRLHGVPTPVNVLLQREVNSLAGRGGDAGSVSPAELLARLDE